MSANMFENCNTDAITLLKVFSAEISAKMTGTSLHGFGTTGFYQIGFKFKGRTRVSYNGENFDYSANTALYLPQEKRADIPYRRKYIEHGGGICVFFASEQKLPEKAELYSFCTNETAECFIDMKNAFSAGRMLEAKSCFYRLLALLDGAKNTENNGVYFKDAMKLIDENIENPAFEISALAEKYGCSEDWFRHKFRGEYGVSPKHYVQTKRINLAKEILLNSEKSIEQTAMSAGFSDSNYFARCFRKETGVSPSQYRRMYKKFM